jgi:hypothetical protein
MNVPYRYVKFLHLAHAGTSAVGSKEPYSIGGPRTVGSKEQSTIGGARTLGSKEQSSIGGPRTSPKSGVRVTQVRNIQ